MDFDEENINTKYLQKIINKNIQSILKSFNKFENVQGKDMNLINSQGN